LTKYHEPVSCPEFVEFELREIHDASELQKQPFKTRLKELFGTEGSGIIFPVSANALIIGYYLHIVLDQVEYTDQKTQIVINELNSILTIFTGLTIALSIERVGHRSLFLVQGRLLHLFNTQTLDLTHYRMGTDGFSITILWKSSHTI
jgi:hypothetical protein